MGAAHMQIMEAEPSRTQPFTTVRYEAFRIPEDSKRAYPLTFKEPSASLDKAVDAAKVNCLHKDRLLIKAVDELRAETSLHLYAVKRQSRPVKVYRDYAYHNEHPLYVEPICTVGPEAFEMIAGGAA